MPRTKKVAKRKPAASKRVAKTKRTTRKVTAKTTRRATTRKTATKRATATRKVKKTTTKRVAKKTAKVEIPKIGKEPLKKSDILKYITGKTELSKKQVGDVFAALEECMEAHLKKRGPGEFTVPGLMKCTVKRKPATKKRKGINPFTGEETWFKAKPARNVVKIRPLKKVKEMAE